MNVQDRRRLLGPANAKPIAFSVPPKDVEESSKEIGNEHLISMHTGLIENCNGSSLVEVKDTSVLLHQSSLITSVYGPRALRGSFTSNASLSIQLENGSLEKYSNSQLKEVSNFLTGIFNSVVNRSRYPKSGIDIFLYLTYDKDLNSDESKMGHLSSIIPYCITGITLALVDAGIEVLDMASAGVHDGNVFAFLKNGQEVAGFWKDDGKCENIMESLEPCRKEYFSYRELMVRHLMEKQASKV
ncbi:hypothetical protein ZYGR_0AD00600 [Zygosaccharomyces rouxii]|uniref:ZYRO0G07282p n=2 Tax=Zygosaccharomyces rouxii TaxID=4956 RepID=C5DZU4_ZYGRC|nr:uncharacterized protein ZYRO0G07282g [Zygosaccharomyces rouxii]KAH9202375.1 3' exoribonuclease family, domain 1-domain-containing protein [Zygosaccharomyces rouxii]GAV50877.1 hypothetical protein ZYGR_0AD00600 [Zygosaccharomyces rouxii]CAR29378.1 ZYRO0G07282p [Zygosaccharomyces rouxii]